MKARVPISDSSLGQDPAQLDFGVATPSGEGLAEGRGNPWDTFNALVATGMLPWDARLLLAKTWPEQNLFPELAALPKSFLLPGAMDDPEITLEALHGIAHIDPVGANAVLNAFLEGRTLPQGRTLILNRDWITALPCGLTVWQLNLSGTNVTSLPDGMKVIRSIELDNSRIETLPAGFEVGSGLILMGSQIRTLPARLKVGDLINLSGCDAWDGQVPADANIGGRIITDQHPNPGIAFTEWRRLHPEGEQA